MKKNNFKISKNIKIAISGGLIALAIVLSVQLVVDAQSLVTDQGNSGVASIAKMQLSPKAESDGNLNDFYFNDEDLNFRLYGTAILDNTIALGDTYFSKGLYAGYANVGEIIHPEEFQIDGNIIIKELADPACIDAVSCAAVPDRPLCTNDFGSLSLC